MIRFRGRLVFNLIYTRMLFRTLIERIERIFLDCDSYAFVGERFVFHIQSIGFVFINTEPSICFDLCRC